MNKQKTKRTWAVILVALLTLVLLLTACSTSGDTPTGDNSTPGVTETPSNTPDATDPTPDDTTEPNTTPSETEPTTPDTDDTKNVLRHTEPLVYNEEWKAQYENEWTDDIDEILEEIYEEYGKYLNVNISKVAMKVRLVTHGWDSSEITPEALEKVNDFLKNSGEESLDTDDTKQRVIAIWIAASLYFGLDDPLVESGEYGSCCFDIAMAFARAKVVPTEPIHSSGVPLNVLQYAGLYDNAYCTLFDIPRPW